MVRRVARVGCHQSAALGSTGGWAAVGRWEANQSPQRWRLVAPGHPTSIMIVDVRAAFRERNTAGWSGSGGGQGAPEAEMQADTKTASRLQCTSRAQSCGLVAPNSGLPPNYQRLNPVGHPNNPTPHAHGHAPGTGPGMRGQGPSLDTSGNVVPWNSPAAHWPFP